MVKTKVCSWDVGIKNLSYCILEKEENNVKIIDWGIINIADTTLTDLVCSGVLKNKSKCNNKCKVYLDNDNIFGYCNQHRTQYNPFTENWEDNYIKEYSGEIRCGHIFPKKKDMCSKKGYFITNDNIVYCKQHTKQFIKKITDKLSLKKIKTDKCTDADMAILTTRMYNKLNKLPQLLQVHEVLIENQPVKKNPTMKTVASVLFGYFVFNGIVNKDKTNSTIFDVKFASPTNKLKVDKNKTKTELAKGKNSSQKYSIGKKLAKEYCITLVSKMNTTNNPTKWNTFFNKHKKKDDLADSFLQGYYDLMFLTK